MDGRKPTPWQNFCEKAKPLLNNMKKGRIPLGKPKVRRKLVRGRRSISVPDFRLLQDDSSSTTSSIPSPGFDPKTLFFPYPSHLPQASTDRSGTGVAEDESEDEVGIGTPTFSVSGSLDEDNQSVSEVKMKVPSGSETPEDKSESQSDTKDPNIQMTKEPDDDSVFEVEFEAVPGTAVPATAVPATPVPATPVPATPEKTFYITVSLKEGRRLVIRDRCGTSDPYVKFKLDDKTIYKSRVMFKNLNPIWNESFNFSVQNLEQKLNIKVYDRNLTTDDFMGGSCILLRDLTLDRTHEMMLPLNDPNSIEDDMGVILLDVQVSATEKENKRNMADLALSETLRKNRLWNSVVGITLLEGQDLPAEGQGDVFVRFRLGDQKFKSKNLCRKACLQWGERFDFNQFQDGSDLLEIDVWVKDGRKNEECLGMCIIDLSKVPFGQEKLFTQALEQGKGKLVLLIVRNPCSGVSISDLCSPMLEDQKERQDIEARYCLKNTLHDMRDVGFLQVKVIKASDLMAADLNGKSDPFCVLELGNNRLQTHTICRTLNPEWNKVFTFPIKDIHDVLEVTVLDDDGDQPPDFLGKVAIPLLSVQNGQPVSYVLKKEDLGVPFKGAIHLELVVIYNRVRAGIRTFKPKEAKLMEVNPKFNKKILARNVYRVRKITKTLLYTLQYIRSCFQWEYKRRSMRAFIIFLLTVWGWEVCMLPLFFLLLLVWSYFQVTTGKISGSADLDGMDFGDDDEDEKESEKKGLREKIHMVQEVLVAVQSILEEIACFGERLKNTFNWSVPFLSILACLVLLVASVVTYVVPLRYIILAWGIHKFTRKLRNPHVVDGSELLDFLQRVPTDVQKVQRSRLKAVSSQNPQRKRWGAL
ncbi:multiple C2 and transmembrane domain-containing protein 2-like [Brienomyrus brachyistius]|uniref:multiple C2 and transmembrane domain-containing protein 2-like n=1 Tax=Brienomyrus brachyistius TaxID=42636 RepID=UPI0020B2442E|nr:multiple C2 and transmembrane domain-containing protein 2-like [Brienomyrus brachyistius]XP_048887367.1 multiple C2 and transmembrane domain-containing protein 2-like [Brienomyrus brachyistius]